MHPAYSIIFFTVASGAGFGLLAILGLAPLFGVAPAGVLGWGGFVIAYALCVGGLLSSTLHLGHPERALLAFTQWRSSWLSREGVLAVATLLTGAVYGAAALLFGAVLGWLGALTALLAFATVWATGMIYAQIKAVDRWHTPQTAACYLAFAAAGGLLLFALLRALATGEAQVGLDALAGIALIGAFALKRRWWARGDAAPARSTPESATGLGGLGTVRLLEAPHTAKNYLLKEMGYQVARKHAEKLRMLAQALGAGAPMLLLVVATVAPAPALWLALAAAAHLAGMLAERWLFFAEAEHAVMTYYSRG